MRHETDCPLCGSPNTESRESIDVQVLVARWREAFQIDASRDLHAVSTIDVRVCSVCSVRFFSPSTMAGSSELYSQLETFDWYYMQQKWEYDIAIEELEGRGRILEVGCGNGAFLCLAKQQLGVEIEGIEINTKAVHEAVGRQLRVRELDVEQAAGNWPATYDAVCCFQVLEHVSNPGEFLRACCTLLRPGGLLLLGVPNADSFLRHDFNPLDMPPHHMSRWPIEAASGLRRFFPLRLRRMRLEPLAEYHVDYYTSVQLSHWLRGPLRFLKGPRTRAIVTGLLRSGVRRWIRGHTIYVCYERI